MQFVITSDAGYQRLDEVAAHLDADRRAALYDEIDALGAQAAGRLRKQAPDHRQVAGTEAGAPQRLLAQRHRHAQHKKQARAELRRAESRETLYKFEDLENRIERMEAEAELVEAEMLDAELVAELEAIESESGAADRDEDERVEQKSGEREGRKND